MSALTISLEEIVRSSTGRIEAILYARARAAYVLYYSESVNDEM